MQKKCDNLSLLCGFSLIELCIALFLMTLIFSALFQQYLQMKQQFEFMEQALDQAIEVQLARDFIRERIHDAGFTPCRHLSALESMDSYHANKPLSSLTIKPDELICRRMEEPFSLASSKPQGRSLTLFTPITLKTGQMVLIADCHHAEVQRVESMNDMQLLLEKPLQFNYVNPFYIGPWLEEAFLTKLQRTGKKVLAYRTTHTEILTDAIASIRAERQSATLVEVELELPSHQTILMKAKVGSV